MSRTIDCVCFSLNDNSIIHREMAVKMVFSLRSKNKEIEIICLYSGNNKDYLKEHKILIDLIDNWGSKNEVIQDIKFLIDLYESDI